MYNNIHNLPGQLPVYSRSPSFFFFFFFFLGGGGGGGHWLVFLHLSRFSETALRRR